MSHTEPGFTLHRHLVVPCCHREPESSGYCFCIQRSFACSSTHHVCSLSKSDRNICVIVPEKKSTEVPGQGKFHFVYFLPISKVYYVCLSVGYICKSNVLQNYLKNTNICLTPGKKKAASRNLDFQTDSASTWASWNDCHLTTLQLPQTVSSLQPPVPPFHIMQPRMAKALP